MRAFIPTLILLSAIGLTGCIFESPRRQPPPPVVEYDRRPPPEYDRRQEFREHRDRDDDYRGPRHY